MNEELTLWFRRFRAVRGQWKSTLKGPNHIRVHWVQPNSKKGHYVEVQQGASFGSQDSFRIYVGVFVYGGENDQGEPVENGYRINTTCSDDFAFFNEALFYVYEHTMAPALRRILKLDRGANLYLTDD